MQDKRLRPRHPGFKNDVLIINQPLIIKKHPKKFVAITLIEADAKVEALIHHLITKSMRKPVC